MPIDIDITAARRDDVPAIAALLRALNLPTDDIGTHLDSAWIAKRNGQLMGCIALERYADGGLLRSAAVAPEAQGHGIGRRLTETVIDAATQLRLPALYLLTTTAESYFPRFGFEQIARDEVPASVRASVEFQSACPASAIVMRRRTAS